MNTSLKLSIQTQGYRIELTQGGPTTSLALVSKHMLRKLCVRFIAGSEEKWRREVGWGSYFPQLSIFGGKMGYILNMSSIPEDT